MKHTHVAPVLTEPQARALLAAVPARQEVLAVMAADDQRGGLERRRLHAQGRALASAGEALQHVLRLLEPEGPVRGGGQDAEAG